jgi:protein-export membrane protein SecD
MVKHAAVVVSQYGGYEISLAMTDEGTKWFEIIIANNIDQQFEIVLNEKLYSAPFICSAIPNRHASISGDFPERDALELSNILNNPLEIELKFIELNEIRPSLAKDARTSSLHAIIIEIIVVASLMAICYGMTGLVSLIAAIANLPILLGIMVTIEAILSLPGIAALVLIIGIIIDANILIIARMREEILSRKSLKIALCTGHENAFPHNSRCKFNHPTNSHNLCLFWNKINKRF